MTKSKKKRQAPRRNKSSSALANKARPHELQTTALKKGNKSSTLANTALYKSIWISGFRLFDDIALENLARINLFFGPNNTGKSSLLEAVYTHACGVNFPPFLAQVLLRRLQGSTSGMLDFGEVVRTAFHDTSTLPYQFQITAQLEGSAEKYILESKFAPSAALADLDPRMLGQTSMVASRTPAPVFDVPFPQFAYADEDGRVRFPQTQGLFVGTWSSTFNDRSATHDVHFPVAPPPAEQPFKLGHFIDLLSHRNQSAETRVFGHLKRYGLLEEFCQELAQAYPDMQDVDMIPYGDGSMGPVYARLPNDRRVPLYAFGDGVRRWFYILGNLIVYQNAIHCIEEIDGTFHPAIHGDLCRLLYRHSVAFQNQIFVTSHSIEFADAFLAALYGEGGPLADGHEDKDDPVRVFTLRPGGPDDTIQVWPLAGREAYKKRKDFGLELR